MQYVIVETLTVSVFAFPQFKVATVASLSLDDKTIALAFPFLNENGIEFELDAVNLLRLPSSQSKDVIVERTASVGTDVEMFAMLLDLDYLVTDNIYARPVAEELFVGRFCIILLRFKELMVKVNIVFLNFLQIACRNQSVYKQCVEFVCSIEIIGLVLVGSIGDVFLCQFLDGSEDGIRAACTKGRMIRGMAHQLCRYIFHA